MAKTKNSFEERRRVYYEIISPIAEIFCEDFPTKTIISDALGGCEGLVRLDKILKDIGRINYHLGVKTTLKIAKFLQPYQWLEGGPQIARNVLLTAYSSKNSIDDTLKVAEIVGDMRAINLIKNYQGLEGVVEFAKGIGETAYRTKDLSATLNVVESLGDKRVINRIKSYQGIESTPKVAEAIAKSAYYTQDIEATANVADVFEGYEKSKEVEMFAENLGKIAKYLKDADATARVAKVLRNFPGTIVAPKIAHNFRSTAYDLKNADITAKITEIIRDYKEDLGVIEFSEFISRLAFHMENADATLKAAETVQACQGLEEASQTIKNIQRHSHLYYKVDGRIIDIKTPVGKFIESCDNYLANLKQGINSNLLNSDSSQSQ